MLPRLGWFLAGQHMFEILAGTGPGQPLRLGCPPKLTVPKLVIADGNPTSNGQQKQRTAII